MDKYPLGAGKFLGLSKERDRFQDEISKLFDDFFRGSWLEPFQSFDQALASYSPRLDIVEGDKEIRVIAELPGVDEKDVEVSLDKDVLTIKGEKKIEHEENDKHYYRMERSYGSFQRSIALPSEVEQDKVDAVFKRGVLTVSLPKTTKAQVQSKKIIVKTQ